MITIHGAHFCLCRIRMNTASKMNIWRLLSLSVLGVVATAASLTIAAQIVEPPQPKITADSMYFLDNETFSLNCTVKRNTPVVLIWNTPRSYQKGFGESNTNSGDTELYNNYTVVNANKDDQGVYSCIASNSAGTKSAIFNKIYLSDPIILMDKTYDISPVNVTTTSWRSSVDIEAYPPVEISVFKNNKTIKKNPGKYIINVEPDKVTFGINNAAVEDTGNYTIKASNKLSSNRTTFDIRVHAPPKIDFKVDKKYHINQIATLTCVVTGYPLPKITWYFEMNGISELITKAKKVDISDIAKSVYTTESQVDILPHDSGNVTCSAWNSRGTNSKTQSFLVYDIDGGFGIKDSHLTWYSEGQNVKLKCLASIYDYKKVSWYNKEDVEMKNVDSINTLYPRSYVATLQINDITVIQGGEYTCKAFTYDGRQVYRSILIEVTANQDPEIVEPDEMYIEVPPYQASVNLTCEAEAVPPPVITWFKFQDTEDKLIDSTTRPQITTVNINHTFVRSTVMFDQAKEEDIGRYECRVTSQRRSETLTKSKYYNLNFKEKPSHLMEYITTSIFIVILLLAVIAYLIWKNRKERQFRKELMAAGLLYFKEGQTKSLNKDLGIDEQADLLPYDERFEFPAEKLKLGNQLGAGAFGVVYKAEARGIINAEESTTVAVKMVKKTADNMYIKALASELKIMVHLGRHLNIVNLLGACTKNVGKRELIVIVEYCKYGNIHNYLLKHREVFNDTLNPNHKERFSGSVNHGFSCSINSGSQFDYSGSNQTQNTANTMLNTGNSNRSDRKVSESGYVSAPEWRSNYESDYVYEGRQPRPLNSCDLLKWAFQIARGMEYLANRKVLHGDLAARNILLTEDNIVKICDFGLARSMYKNDEYLKKENSPLPVKWLAIECMTYRLFSTQSDVWSYGVVLWELFSLARTPYPNINPQNLLQWLCQGNRLESPQYANDKIYSVMKRCWVEKPAARPTFTDLQEEIGCFLEDTSRNRYIDLNAPYMEMNQQRLPTEDYLNMLTAPDYNNLVTPSPHMYGNDAREFFPPTPNQLQHDEQGYLQMSPASRQSLNARVPKFDFDEHDLGAKKPNSFGSELTPMLVLNDIQRSGSESDEGNQSPYQNVEAPIHEEVQETMKNNAKNIQTTAFSNLEYTLAPEIENKLQNNYTNIKITPILNIN